jgi:hypothetical protein
MKNTGSNNADNGLVFLNQSAISNS